MATIPFPYSSRRIIAAFLIAPLVASAALASGLRAELPNVFSVSSEFKMNDRDFFDWFSVFFFSSVLVSCPSTLLIGLPAFFILRTKVALSLLNCVLVGVVVAAAPWIAWVLFRNPNYWSDGPGRIYHMDGHYTAIGWIEVSKGVLYYLAFLAPLGALAGIAFWVIAAAGSHRVSQGNPELSAGKSG
jgi:hypothetical protein